MDQQDLSGSSKIDRKTTEKNRREQMKALLAELKSVQPHQSSRVFLFLSITRTLF